MLRLISRFSNNEVALAIWGSNCLRSVHEGLHANLPFILVSKPQVCVLLSHAHSNSKVMPDGTRILTLFLPMVLQNLQDNASFFALQNYASHPNLKKFYF